MLLFCSFWCLSHSFAPRSTVRRVVITNAAAVWQVDQPSQYVADCKNLRWVRDLWIRSCTENLNELPYFWILLNMFQHFDPLDRTAWYFRILWLVLHLCRSESDEMSSVTHLSFQFCSLSCYLVFVCSSQSRVLLVFSNCHLRWSCGPMMINYYNLPQLSPVDACDRQGPRMGDTQAGENLVEFFQTNPWVWSKGERTCSGPGGGM